jgi:hypothetical protein
MTGHFCQSGGLSDGALAALAQQKGRVPAHERQ